MALPAPFAIGGSTAPCSISRRPEDAGIGKAATKGTMRKETPKRPCIECGRGIRWGAIDPDGRPLLNEASRIGHCYDCRIKAAVRKGKRC